VVFKHYPVLVIKPMYAIVVSKLGTVYVRRMGTRLFDDVRFVGPTT